MKASIRLAFVVSVLGGAIGCSSDGDDDDPGACYLRELICASCESTTDDNFCGKRTECASYCATMMNRATTVYCEWHDDGVCTQDIPSLPKAPLEVCAVTQTIKCGTSSGTTTNFCDSDCSIRPGSNDYDAELGCLTEYGSKQGRGASCDEAFADLSDSGTVPVAPSTPDPEPTQSSENCTAQPGDTACLSCAKQRCCDELEACATIPECVDIYGCLAACTDATCQQGCADTHPGGVSGINAYLSCGATSCASECGG